MTSKNSKSQASIYLSIVVPLYNEEESVEKLVSRITDVGTQFDFKYEFILVDDGSIDNTWQIIERLKPSNRNLRGIKLRRNYGQTNAMVAGFNHAAGEIIVTLDGDLQNDPSDIPKLLDKIEEGYDVVSGWRKKRKDSILRVIPSKIANYIISKTTRIRLHDYGCSLKAYRAECIKALKAYGEMHRFFPAYAGMTGARIAEIPVQHFQRQYGVSKYGFDRIFKVFSDIFSMNLIIRFSGKPLRAFVLCAIPLIFAAFFFGLLSLLSIVFQWTAGKTEFFFFAATILGVGIIHLVFFGIIGELLVGFSDLTHTEMPELTKRGIKIENHEN